MLRRSLLYLSESAAAKRVVTRAPISRGIAERFVAGDTLDDAVAAARAVNELGMSASLDYLGEAVSSREEAEAAADMAITAVERIAAEGLDANISVKPTQLGLEVDGDFCRQNVERILRRASELDEREDEIFVRLDMEASEFTGRTVELAESLWRNGHRNVGTVLQSYLRRTPDDVDRLVALGMRIRLVKGAYNEPESVAFPDKADVDRMFVHEMHTLIEQGNFPAIATHDEFLIDATRRWAFEHGIQKGAFEFQMLYGIRRDLQQRLVEEGYNVRVYIPFGDSWYPYLMRRLAERPANLFFIASSVLRESPMSALTRPAAIGVGAATGAIGTLLWKGRRRNGPR